VNQGVSGSSAVAEQLDDLMFEGSNVAAAGMSREKMLKAEEILILA